MFQQDPLNTIIGLASEFTPTAVRLAATLKLPDLIESGHSSLDALARQTDCDRQALGRALNYLCQLGLFTRAEDGTYAVTEVGAVLSSSHPGGLRRWLDLNEPSRPMEARFEPAISLLPEAVRTGEPVYAKAHGQPFWDDLKANPDIEKSFNSGIARTAARLVPELSRIYDWDTVKHVVDVGGGTGALLARLLTDHPALNGTLVELDSVVEEARATLIDVADRCTLAPGSFFEALPPGHDAYLIANTLHNWNDRDAVKIMRRCTEAAGRGGKVIVVERLLDSGKDPMMASYADLLMLVLLGARERSQADLSAMGAEVGLELTGTKRFELPGHWLLEFTVTA